MSNRNLNQALFHGTNAVIPEGKRVQAATKGGHFSHWDDTGEYRGQASRDHAFATTSESTAWHFAQHATRSTGGRARVYEVAPNPRMKPGIHTELQEYIAPSFRVKTAHDIKPGQQGTFPQIEWNKHQDWENASVGSHIDFDANHPEHEPSTVMSRNADVDEAQRQAHAKFSSRRDSLGQLELFGREDVKEQMSSSASRQARHHDVRHLIAEVKAPGVELDHEMAEAEAQDNWNKRQGRRSNAVGRLNNDRAWLS